MRSNEYSITSRILCTLCPILYTHHMAFIDEIKFHIKAGKGGNGVVRWRHEKGKEFAGASGGNGGRGGSVYVLGVRDIGLLARYKHKKEFLAENGGDGMKQTMHGKDGKDLVIDLPLGSVITNLKYNTKTEILFEGEKIKILDGGRGGLGNEHFKSSTNTTPRQFTLGEDGAEADFYIELSLIVDAGFIGFPNAGKSSLLNALTNANSKVAGYAFTTLEPSLGDFFGFILADIPGLIEGASKGKGLGHKFLRHIKRTKMLLHCISLENEDIVGSYKIIRKELSQYSEELMSKEEVLILTKSDLVDDADLKESRRLLYPLNKNIFDVTVYDDKSIKQLADNLITKLRSL